MDPVVGKRVTLRPFRADEFELVWSARSSSAGVTVRRQGSPRAARARFRRRFESSGRMVNGRLDLGIEVGGRLVGEIDVRHPPSAIPPGVYELGIQLFDTADRGKGVGTEAVLLLTDYLIDAYEAGRVQASTSLENTPMRRALERAGYTFEGTMRGFMPVEGGREDYALYAVTAADRARTRRATG